MGAFRYLLALLFFGFGIFTIAPAISAETHSAPVAVNAPSKVQNEIVRGADIARQIEVLRLTVVIMGVGMAGGLVRLRQLTKAVNELQNKN